MHKATPSSRTGDRALSILPAQERSRKTVGYAAGLSASCDEPMQIAPHQPIDLHDQIGDHTVTSLSMIGRLDRAA
jgi:hypothetical protein